MYRRYLLESSASLESTQYDCLCLLSVKLRAASQSKRSPKFGNLLVPLDIAGVVSAHF
ncbi:hypothetical protein VSDG_04277 [Cytospora chrysosperma]|uniref:Uncharacterized protein n=1 Tax=Cytospora chrysosperma TaxID=252740 RepID=A0A423W5M2_CYTCH|nr:hypothetical protein VSDG_04277 [Valsa sordida]